MRTPTTVGGQRLRVWLSRQGLTQAAFAAIAGVSQAAVAAWVVGSRRPSAEMRSHLLHVCGIPRIAWDRSPQ